MIIPVCAIDSFSTPLWRGKSTECSLGSETPIPDDDPMDCQGHGTHVAGIIGASNDDYILGVAPAATLGIYKVFGCTGQVANDVLIEAFTMAYNAGADIITASIGGASGWPEEYVPKP